MLFIPLYLLETLEDDLIRTGDSEKQFKNISYRKDCLEGHTVDEFACGLFQIVFTLRFRPRGEAQTENDKRLLKTLLDG